MNLLSQHRPTISPFACHIPVSSTCLLDSVRCSHNPSLALSRCSSAHWLFVLALSLLSCPFSNLACILSSTSFPPSSVLSGMHFPYMFCLCSPFYDLLIPRRLRGLFMIMSSNIVTHFVGRRFAIPASLLRHAVGRCYIFPSSITRQSVV